MDDFTPSLNWEAEFNKPSTRGYAVGRDIFLFSDYRPHPMCYEPFVLDFVMVSLLQKGKVSFALGNRVFEAKAPAVVVIQPSVPRRIIEEPKDTRKNLLALSKNITNRLFANASEKVLLTRPFLLNPIMPLSEKQYQDCLYYFNAIEREINDTENPRREKTVENLLRVLISKHSIPETIESLLRPDTSNKDILMHYFYAALDRFHKKERSIDFYAQKLNVSPQYLSKVIREVSGRPAGQWIDGYVIDSMKASLRSEGKSMKAVADEFSFHTVDNMGKYFKRHAEMSPSAYRKKYRI